MTRLTHFNQSDLLKGVTDPLVRGGICVALCDAWLALIRGHTARTPSERMDQLRITAPSAMSYQRDYLTARDTQGREAARAQVGARLGHRFEERTVVTESIVGKAGIRATMARDLSEFGAAACWTMEMPGVGRHAIAGYRGLLSMMSNVHAASLHIFDPNLGEYVGGLGELDLILQDLFGRIPMYGLVSELNRTRVR